MEFILNRGICFANSVLTNSIVKLSFVLKFDYLFAEERHLSFSAIPLSTGVVKFMDVSCQFYLDTLNCFKNLYFYLHRETLPNNKLICNRYKQQNSFHIMLAFCFLYLKQRHKSASVQT